jgi:hypothetical protein
VLEHKKSTWWQEMFSNMLGKAIQDAQNGCSRVSHLTILPFPFCFYTRNATLPTFKEQLASLLCLHIASKHSGGAACVEIAN